MRLWAARRVLLVRGLIIGCAVAAAALSHAPSVRQPVVVPTIPPIVFPSISPFPTFSPPPLLGLGGADSKRPLTLEQVFPTTRQPDDVLITDGRVRAVGAGRKPVEQSDPDLWPGLERLVDPETRGDPMSEEGASGQHEYILNVTNTDPAGSDPVPERVHDAQDARFRAGRWPTQWCRMPTRTGTGTGTHHLRGREPAGGAVP